MSNFLNFNYGTLKKLVTLPVHGVLSSFPLFPILNNIYIMQRFDERDMG